MTAVAGTGTAGGVLAGRRRADHPRGTAQLRRAYDDYLASRLRYKEEFFEAAAALAGAGPVLDAGRGYGAPVLPLLLRVAAPAVAIAESAEAAALYRDRLVAAGCANRVAVRVAAEGIPPPEAHRYPLVVCVNALHTWPDPVRVLLGMYDLLAPGGTLLATDLRRDADPFIAEYVLRELADPGAAEHAYQARTFAESLAAALTTAELRAGLAATGLPHWRVEPDAAMAVTIEIQRR